MTRAFQTAALAAIMLVATASASIAATWAWAAQDANVRKNHSQQSSVVNYIEEGQEVRVIGQWNNWYKLQLPGPDGWVRTNAIDFDYGDYDDGYAPGKPGFGTQFCVDSKNAQFCLGTQF